MWCSQTGGEISILLGVPVDRSAKLVVANDSRPRSLGTPPLALLLVTCQHSLLSRDALTEHVLKRGVTLAPLDVLRDCGADHVRNGLAVDGRDRVQFL